MKKIVGKSFQTGIISFLLLFFIVSSSAYSQESGWENKGEYLEQKLKVGSISFLQYSKDGKHFYTFGADNIFRKWESESGKLIDEQKIPYPVFSLSLSPNEKKIAFSFSYSSKDRVIIYDLVKNSEIYQIDPLIDYKDQSDEWLNYYTNTLLFNSDSTLLINTLSEHTIENGRAEDSRCRLTVFNLTSGVSNIVQNAVSPKDAIRLSNDKQHFSECVNDYYSVSIGMGGRYISESSRLSLLDNNFIKIRDFYNITNSGSETDYEDYIRINRMINVFFSNDNKYVVGLYDQNEIWFWELNTGDLFRKIKMGYPHSYYFPKDVAFSKNNNYFITASKGAYNSSDAIRFWDIQSGLLIDSLNLSASKITISDDSLSLLAIEADKIYLIKPEFLSKKVFAIFKSDTNKALVNNPVHFKNYSHGKPDKFLWIFGDGATSSEENPVHIYSQPGNYNVTLIITLDNLKDTLIKENYIFIRNIITPDFSASGLSGFAPLEVHFEDKSIGNVLSWSWDFGDGIKSNEQNPTYIFDKEARFPVTLTVSDSVFEYSIQKMITVQQKPITEFDVAFEKYFGNDEYEWTGNSGVQCLDGGYIICGQVKLLDESTGYEKVFSLLIRLDKNGDTLWTKRFDNGLMVQQLSDGCFILIGHAYKNHSDFWVIKIDNKGEKVWENILGTDTDDDYHNLLSTPDGGFMMIGHTYYQAALNTLIIKCDKDGNQEYFKVFSGDGGTIINTKDGGYALNVFSSNVRNMILIKINKDGVLEWKKEYGQPLNLFTSDIIETSDGFLACGHNRIDEYNGKSLGYLIKTDKNGDKIWETQTTDEWIQFYSLVNYKNDYIVTGDLSGVIGFRTYDTIGTVVKNFSYQNRKGMISTMSPTTDGGFFAVGTIKPFLTKSKIFALKINGEKDTSKTDTSIIVEKGIISSPNPTSGTGLIYFNNEKAGNIVIKLYSLTGILQGTICDSYMDAGVQQIPFKLVNYADGMYYYTIEHDGKFLGSGKIAVMK